jgi:hypothetical protein
MPYRIGEYTYDWAEEAVITVPQSVSKPRRIYPVDGNSSIYTEEEDFVVAIDYYVPLRPSQRNPESSNMFFVKDSPIQDIGAGMGRFTRTWSILPGTNDKGYSHAEYESFAWTVPARDTAQDGFYLFPQTSTTLSNGIHTMTVATLPNPPWNALDIEAGKPITVHYRVTDSGNGQRLKREIFRKALSVTTNTVTFDYVSDIGPIEFLGVQRADINQPNYTKTVWSRIEYDYWIPGVNCDSIEDVDIINELQIVDNNTGGRVEYLSETTTPSIDDWLDAMSAYEWFVVEPSIIRRWQGNIYQRATRYIQYQL